MESKGVYKNKSDYKFDNETYLDRTQEEKLKYYEDMSYDSITKEISQNIDYHTKDAKEHIKRLEDYIKTTGHEIPLDKIDNTALLPEHDDY
jgi:response regulator RpfG family c-di-GMP phosphodiesterase